MNFDYVTLDQCHAATGLVVVIDVIRAFTTAAYALANNATTIALVSTTDEAFNLRARHPNSLVMGEVAGRPVAGFDYGNSPAAMAHTDFAGRLLIQRTSAGTQGAVRSVNASQLLVSSFVCAAATARYVAQLQPKQVTFVITGRRPKYDGDEDRALADYVTALLQQQTPNPAPFIERVYRSTSAQQFLDPAQPDFPQADLTYCTDVDRFNFAMPVQRRHGLLLIEPVDPLATRPTH